jgi:hypothetical protein
MIVVQTGKTFNGTAVQLVKTSSAKFAVQVFVVANDAWETLMHGNESDASALFDRVTTEN